MIQKLILNSQIVRSNAKCLFKCLSNSVLLTNVKMINLQHAGINNQQLLKCLTGDRMFIKRNLTENRYERLVEETLESLNDYFDELLENQTKIINYDLSLSDGVLTINLDTYGTYVINKQTPNKQIWISSPISGPKRYDYIDGVWIYKHDNCSLHDLLNHEITSILELNDIDFSKACCEQTKR